MEAGAEASSGIKVSKKVSTFLIQRACAFKQGVGGGVESDWIGPGLMPGADGKAVVWKDVGEVKVPAGSHRSTVVRAALAQFEIDYGDLPAVFRVLDMDAAEPIPVRLETPPPPQARVKVG